jgi:hypothetical protein
VNNRRETGGLRLVLRDGTRIDTEMYDRKVPWVQNVQITRPDGSRQVLWELDALVKDPANWQMWEYGLNNSRVRIPLKLVAEGNSLGGASWLQVDRHAAQTQPASTRP